MRQDWFDADDRTLIQGLAEHDPEAAVAFVRRFWEMTYWVGYRILRNEALAQDAAENTLAKTILRAGRGDFRLERASLKTYIYIAARNEARDFFEKEIRRATSLVKEQENVLPYVTTDLDRQTIMAIIERCFQALSWDLCQVITLYLIDEHTQSAIAQMLGIALGTVNYRLQNAKRQVSDCIRDDRIYIELEGFI